jgi:hypothetical protein
MNIEPPTISPMLFRCAFRCLTTLLYISSVVPVATVALQTLRGHYGTAFEDSSTGFVWLSLTLGPVAATLLGLRFLVSPSANCSRLAFWWACGGIIALSLLLVVTLYTEVLRSTPVRGVFVDSLFYIFPVSIACTVLLLNLVKRERGPRSPTSYQDAESYFTHLDHARYQLREAVKTDSASRSFRDRLPTITCPSDKGVEDHSTDAKVAQDVVVLVHGIRDFALWQASIRATLERDGFAVEPTNYGRFNLVKFLAPIPFFRRWAIGEVWEQIRIVKQRHPGARLSLIAHSFGTYVVAHLIRRNFDLGAHRIIFCGSVVSYRFRFQDYQGRFEGDILNDVGTQDIWPALAQSVTWGYGSAGTYGFRRPLVHDRWHNGAGHGYFLRPEFCTKFWVPYLKSGTIVDGDHDPESPPLWLRVVSILKIKYLLLGLAAYSLYLAGMSATYMPRGLGAQFGVEDSIDSSTTSCFANPGGYASWPVAFSSQPPGASVRVALLVRTERDPWLEKQEGVEQLQEVTPTCAILAQNRYRAVFERNGQRRFQDFVLTGPKLVIKAKF